MKYVSWKERKKAAAAMRPIYTALNEAAAKTALENLRRDFGKKSPGMVAAWERAWDNFVPFLAFLDFRSFTLSRSPLVRSCLTGKAGLTWPSPSGRCPDSA